MPFLTMGVRLLWRAMERLIEKIGVQVCVARSKSDMPPILVTALTRTSSSH